MQQVQGIPRNNPLRMEIISFGFKYGLPREAELVMDVRCFPNPHSIPELKTLDGKDQRVRTFITKWPETPVFMEKTISLLEFLIPLYENKGRESLVIGIGCTGGRHRSVVIAEELCSQLHSLNRQTNLSHRDIALG